jgi:ribosome-binding factor A
MTSTKFKALTRLSFEQSIEKAKIKDKYSKKGDLIKLLINRNSLNEQLEKVLVNQKINRVEHDYNNLRRQLFNEYKINRPPLNKTAQIRAHHLTNFLYNYLINAIQSGTLDIDYLTSLNNDLDKKFNFQISKIQLKSDLNYLYIYWFTSINDKLNERIEQIYLPKLGNQIRYLLASNRVIGYVPPIKFIRDTSRAMLEQLDDYLKNIKEKSKDNNDNNNDDNIIFNNNENKIHVKIKQLQP